MALSTIRKLIDSGPKLPGTTKPDVRVQVRRRIVQIECKDSSVRRVVPIPAA